MYKLLKRYMDFNKSKEGHKERFKRMKEKGRMVL